MHKLSLYRDEDQDRDKEKPAGQKLQREDMDLEKMSRWTWEHRQVNVAGSMCLWMELESKVGDRHGQLCGVVMVLDVALWMMECLWVGSEQGTRHWQICVL